MTRDPYDRLGQPHDRVLVVGHRPVAGATGRAQAHPRVALLRGLEEVRPRGRATAGRLQGDRVAADLADRLGAVREQLGPVPYDPLRSPDPARLLVGEEREHEVTRRGDLVRDEVAEVGQHHADHVLHVDRAPPVQHAVHDVAREGVVAPRLGVGRHDVEMPVQDQPGTAAVRAGDAYDEARPARRRLHVLRLEADLTEKPQHVLGRPVLTGPRPVTDVGRVDPYELGRDPDGLFGKLLRHGGHCTRAASPQDVVLASARM